MRKTCNVMRQARRGGLVHSPLLCHLPLFHSLCRVWCVIKFHSLAPTAHWPSCALSQCSDRAVYSAIGALVLLLPPPPAAHFYGKHHLIGCHDKFPALGFTYIRGELTLCQILSKSSSNFDGVSLSFPAESSCLRLITNCIRQLGLGNKIAANCLNLTKNKPN